MLARKINPSFIVALVLFAVPAIVALTLYPPYYEDESWVYLSPFEALRGNGFSWAAFHEGSSESGLFDALAFVFVAASPFAAEVSVRLTSLLFGLAGVIATFVSSRRLSGVNAAIAPVLLILAPMWFLSARYGRTDELAIAFAMWAVAAAAYDACFVAGVLSGLAVGVHPGFVWIGPVCAVIAFQRSGWRSVWRYALGGLVGVAPQLAWIGSHFRDSQSIATNFFSTSSLGNGWVSSVANEWARYRAYVASLTLVDVVVQAIGFAALPALALIRAPRRERLLLGSIALIPLVGLTLLFRTKNPYYFIHVLPFLAVVAAAGARKLPARLVEAVCLVALCLAAIRYTLAAREAAKAPTVTQLVDALASRLPQDAVVFAPLNYGGLIRRRPDVAFFAYHALSTRPGWGLPPCEEIPRAIHSLIENDPRPTSRHHNEHVVYFANSWDYLWYLQTMFRQATPADAACILGNSSPEVIHVCGRDPANCYEVRIVERRLP